MSDSLAWVDERLAAAGRRRTGPLTIHRGRAWASVWTAPTDAGPAWLKITTPDTAAEVPLCAILATAVPEYVLHPLGADGRRLLLPDAGPNLLDQRTGAFLVDGMAAALRRYAELQQRMVPEVGSMLAAGVADMRPAALPARFDAALDIVDAYAREHAPEDLQRLRALRPQFAQWCAELADDRRASVDHNDLHGENVVGTAPDWRFYDWGDAVVAHPFASLLTVYHAFPASAAPALRDAYLAAFGDPAGLRRVAELAVRVANVPRALVWVRALGPDWVTSEHADAPLACLRRMLTRT